eukprot:scaffold414137_cov33-Prasinocladus_malaysianus.AAC.1
MEEYDPYCQVYGCHISLAAAVCRMRAKLTASVPVRAPYKYKYYGYLYCPLNCTRTVRVGLKTSVTIALVLKSGPNEQDTEP